jgi:hypothetical protein
MTSAPHDDIPSTPGRRRQLKLKLRPRLVSIMGRQGTTARAAPHMPQAWRARTARAHLLDVSRIPPTILLTFIPEPRLLAEWDRLVRASGESKAATLSASAGVPARAGYSTLFVLASRDGRLVGGALVLCRRRFVALRTRYVAYGPVISNTVDDRGSVTDALVEVLATVTKKNVPLQP